MYMQLKRSERQGVKRRCVGTRWKQEVNKKCNILPGECVDDVELCTSVFTDSDVDELVKPVSTTIDVHCHSLPADTLPHTTTTNTR